MQRVGRSQPRQPWLRRFALAGALAAVLAYTPYRLFDGGGMRHSDELELELRSVRERAARLRRDNRRLRREIRALRTDPIAIERLARDDLGMIYPHEIVIQWREAQP